MSGKLSASTQVVYAISHRAGIWTHTLLRILFIVPWKMREMKSFPQMSRFLINLPIVFVPTLHSEGWIYGQWELRLEIYSKFEELCWCCCSGNCQSNQHSFCLGKGSQGLQVSRFPLVLSQYTQLQISNYRPAPLMILHISLQMREKSKKTDVESSQHVLPIKIQEAET